MTNIEKQRQIVIIAVLAVVTLAGALWWEYTLSHDFRQAAVAAVAEIDTVVDHVRCGESTEHLNLAVHKAEVEVSNEADKKAAKELREYYKVVADGVQHCEQGVEFQWMMYQHITHKTLGLK